MYIRLLWNSSHATIVYKHDSSVQTTVQNIRILKINGYLGNIGTTYEYTRQEFEGNKTIKLN